MRTGRLQGRVNFRSEDRVVQQRKGVKARQPNSRGPVAPAEGELRSVAGRAGAQVGPVARLWAEQAALVSQSGLRRAAEALRSAGGGQLQQGPGHAGRPVGEAGKRCRTWRWG